MIVQRTGSDAFRKNDDQPQLLFIEISMLFAALCFYQLDLPSLSRLTNFAYLLLYATIDTSEQGERGKRARKASAESELESGLQAVDDLLQT